MKTRGQPDYNPTAETAVGPLGEPRTRTDRGVGRHFKAAILNGSLRTATVTVRADFAAA